MARVNYLNNRDMLLEIHKSKKSYCYYTDKEKYSDFDVILDSVKDIPASIPTAIENRAKRLSIEASDIKITDLVFRVTSFAHIPEAPIKEKKVRRSSKKVDVEVDSDVADELDLIAAVDPIAVKYVKLRFPPFLHYILKTDGTLEIVGKSHWTGSSIEDGVFDQDQGQPTPKLALMWMKICERYASRGNYRGYSFNDDMVSQGLMQLVRVGLQFNEARSQNPFAFYTQIITNSFSRVLNEEKKSRDIRDDLLLDAGYDPSFSRQQLSAENDSDGSI